MYQTTSWGLGHETNSHVAGHLLQMQSGSMRLAYSHPQSIQEQIVQLANVEHACHF